MSGFYAGAAAGAILGPPGAIVGSIAGYMLASFVYQSCMALLHEARLDARLAERAAIFDDCFRAMDAARETGRPNDAIDGLSSLVAICGRELGLATFEEFDKFMTESDDPVVL